MEMITQNFVVFFPDQDVTCKVSHTDLKSYMGVYIKFFRHVIFLQHNSFATTEKVTTEGWTLEHCIYCFRDSFMSIFCIWNLKILYRACMQFSSVFTILTPLPPFFHCFILLSIRNSKLSRTTFFICRFLTVPFFFFSLKFICPEYKCRSTPKSNQT